MEDLGLSTFWASPRATLSRVAGPALPPGPEMPSGVFAVGGSPMDPDHDGELNFNFGIYIGTATHYEVQAAHNPGFTDVYTPESLYIDNGIVMGMTWPSFGTPMFIRARILDANNKPASKWSPTLYGGQYDLPPQPAIPQVGGFDPGDNGGYFVVMANTVPGENWMGWTEIWQSTNGSIGNAPGGALTYGDYVMFAVQYADQYGFTGAVSEWTDIFRAPFPRAIAPAWANSTWSYQGLYWGADVHVDNSSSAYTRTYVVSSFDGSEAWVGDADFLYEFMGYDYTETMRTYGVNADMYQGDYLEWTITSGHPPVIRWVLDSMWQNQEEGTWYIQLQGCDPDDGTPEYSFDGGVTWGTTSAIGGLLGTISCQFRSTNSWGTSYSEIVTLDQPPA